MAALAPPGPEATPDLVAEGRELYLVFCSPCHGGSGHGDGTVTRRGYPPPPSFHEGPAREMTAERIVAVITRGQGRMISYADRIPPRERWAVARYLKELQAQAPSPPARREAPPPAASVSPETAPWLPFVREGQP
jgi:mono/diheme cytochrome c family protein